MYTVIKANPIITLLGACVELTPELEARINDHAKKLEKEKIDKLSQFIEVLGHELTPLQVDLLDMLECKYGREVGITIVEHKSPKIACHLSGSRMGKSISQLLIEYRTRPVKQTYRNPQSQHPIPRIKKGDK